MEIQQKRSMSEMLKMPRDCARSLQLTHNIRYKGDLLKGAFFLWLEDYFTTVLRGKHPFPEYDLSDPRAGIHVMPNAGNVDGTEVGYCGFGLLELNNEALTVSYRDETGRVLLSERWVRTDDGARGEIVSCESDLLTLERPIEDLIA